MTAAGNPNQVLWIATQLRQSLCDVPWQGTSVILSDASVNFCCFSSAVVGSVNEESFEQIWNGPIMQRIRQALSEQRLPPECQSTRCPIYRDDDQHFILDRMKGPNSFKATGTHDPHSQAREQLQRSELRVNRKVVQPGDILEVNLDFHYKGEPMVADLFVGIRSPDDVIYFLPNFEEYAVPFRSDIEFSEDQAPQAVKILAEPVDVFQIAGEYQICTALFESGSNPNLLSNCYWSANKTIILSSRSASLRGLSGQKIVARTACT